ncbi:MAG: HigA family addiction module antidote protein [Hyphomicrobium sp.]|nr:HigA family addiction module antidote protein [Hyphomicrobium sp.]
MSKRHASIKPVHPGEIVQDVFETLKAEKDLTKPAFAKALGISRQTLHDVMTCKRSVTPEMALRLEAAIGSDAETWLALQIDHDLHYGRAAFDVSKVKRIAAQTTR